MKQNNGLYFDCNDW